MCNNSDAGSYCLEAECKIDADCYSNLCQGDSCVAEKGLETGIIILIVLAILIPCCIAIICITCCILGVGLCKKKGEHAQTANSEK